jgi:DNA-binding transcriptional regulator YdaS (Cro superfamily)
VIDRPEPIQRAIDQAGGLVALAGLLRVAPSTLSEWRRIPAERVLAVEQASGVSRHELRPDLYPESA